MSDNPYPNASDTMHYELHTAWDEGYAEGFAAGRAAAQPVPLSDLCTCEACGHVQVEPNWCHKCRHRTTIPEWAKPLLKAWEDRIPEGCWDTPSFEAFRRVMWLAAAPNKEDTDGVG